MLALVADFFPCGQRSMRDEGTVAIATDFHVEILHRSLLVPSPSGEFCDYI
jgi:hypothetical protein